MNNVSSDLMNGGEMVHVIFLQVLRVLYVLKRVILTFGCQEVGFLRVHCRQWASLAVLARSVNHTLLIASGCWLPRHCIFLTSQQAGSFLRKEDSPL